MKENDVIAGHLKDLAHRSFYGNIYTFSDFLNENETAVLMSLENELRYAGMELFGGTQNSSRCIVRFGKESDLGYPGSFPITCLVVRPLAAKFGEELSHRDYLGALMNLGIERQLLGDIIISGKTAYIFCLDHIADFICENLTQIRRTSVTVSSAAQVPPEAGPRTEEMTLIVPSERPDAMISKLFNLSRSQSSSLFSSGKIFINGRQCENTSAALKPGDKISVRGFGKFIYDGTSGLTGKGRCKINVRVFR